MKNTLMNHLTAPTPQTEQAAEGQTKNNAGGFAFVASDVQRLLRFLILGTDGGTYYVSERDLTKQNFDFVKGMLEKDFSTVIETVVDVSVNARAPKNSAALFVLALALSSAKTKDDKDLAADAVNKVARTATHLFEFVGYLKALGGLGPAKRRAIANWYLSKTPEQAAYQAVKYRQRNGFTHRDLFRLSHPVGFDTNLGNFILGKGFSLEEAPDSVKAFLAAQTCSTPMQAVEVIEKYRKSAAWEFFPTSLHNSPEFWKMLFYTGMGQTALLRNVTRFAKLNLFDDLVFAGDVAEQLADPEDIARGKMHPVQYLNALYIYSNGKVSNGFGSYHSYGDRESLTYRPNANVSGALEKGFYQSFGNIKPSGKRTMISVDVSASMTWGAPAGLVGLTYREAAAAMAMVTLRSEKYSVINAFAGYMVPINVSSKDSIETVAQKFGSLRAGSTDCAAPMLHALDTKKEIDHFVIYTDNETWAGYIHPHVALERYNKKMGREARLTVVGMAGNEFSIADPTDPLMMDVVGFDSAAPGVIADFGAGRI